MWVNCADIGGMGLGLGLIVTSLITKSVFAPFIIYSVTKHIRLTNGKHEEIFLTRSKYIQDKLNVYRIKKQARLKGKK
jgi:hypothetical protein